MGSAGTDVHKRAEAAGVHRVGGEVFSFRPDVFTLQADVFSLDWRRVRFGVTTPGSRVATIERGAAPRKSPVANADDASPRSRFREPGRTSIAIAHLDS